MQTLQTFEFDPVSISIYEYDFVFPNIDTAELFILELEKHINDSLTGVEGDQVHFEEGQDYDLEEVPFFLSAKDALDYIVSQAEIIKENNNEKIESESKQSA